MPEVPQDTPASSSTFRRLSESPEFFAFSTNNPFSCPPPSEGPCDWQYDATVARSEQEAVWMGLQGYPTRLQRQWASEKSVEEVIAEARHLNSPALWTLGLEKRIAASDDAGEVAEWAMQLERVATQGKSLYALERSAIARATVIHKAVEASGWEGFEGSADDRITSARGDITRAALRAVILGDPAAVHRIDAAMGAIPGARARGVTLENASLFWLAGSAARFQQDLARASRLASVGVSDPTLYYSLSDIQPRPVVRQISNESGAAIWVGVP